ncbi:hypothetical protein [Rhodococcus spongiicola]|nr:hypothetical protein [Rhodococcus spongiicola]
MASIFAGIVVLIAAAITPNWFMAGVAVVWAIATIVAVGNVARKGRR